MELLVALDGADGYRKAANAQPDLILLDVRMPGLDGFATCRKIRSDARTANIPVIFLSASSDVKDKLEGFRVGANDYIEKPFHQEEVLARVTTWLRAGHAQRETRTDTLDAGLAVATQSSRKDQLFNHAIGLICKKLAEPVSVELLAQRLGTNKEKLTAIFRERLGLSVFEYTTELRLELARHDLAETDTQIQQIAQQSGYRNAGDFTRAFKRRFGQTPREFRLSARTDTPA
jgi:YesN/AraC family two-component response regulator